MIGKIEMNELSFNNELEYSMQLTIFQSIKEQAEFLDNHKKVKIIENHPEKTDWLDRIDELEALIEDKKDKAGYYYLDVEEKKIIPVPVG